MNIPTLNFPDLYNCTVAVIGLGYVGLPLAVEFAKPRLCVRSNLALRRRVIGFDINEKRLCELRSGIDRTNETTTEEIQAAGSLMFTSDFAILEQADVFVVTVPTPIDRAKRPDLAPLEKASALVGRALQARLNHRGTSLPVVIYESTVYPGATEEICVPILERESGLRLNEGFCCGYSPERINPGDTEHKLTTITKVTSGSSLHSAAWVDRFYGSVIGAGTYKASSIKVAEAAKVIENTQRDLNIALVNELAMIFRKLGIDTLDVLQAAGTKWNFLPFRPGLVGGHCIGVDPYYLTHKAEEVGYHPQIVLAGRRINDAMGRWVAEQLVLELARRRHQVVDSNVLVMGLSFKENCPDLRNSKVLDVLDALSDYGMQPVVVDPCVDILEATHMCKFKFLSALPSNCRFKAVLPLVPHDEFRDMSAQHWEMLLEPGGVLFDIKGIVPRELVPVRI
jgi:UDP-N-acetyl-D-galactosamine dehydrogenase